MDILKAMACLLDYPKDDVAQYKADIALLISNCREVSPDHRAKLLVVLADIYDGELMDAEERYTSLFEQGRSLSLHLFEHVHGESRDRGQAMVDLMAEYSNNGYEIDSRELPDYIPMFLEYLSSRPDLEAREWLADVSHILAVLGARLTERESSYAHLFESLLVIAGKNTAMEEQRETVAQEEPDNTFEALDREWEETAVTFGVDDSAACGVSATSNKGALAPDKNEVQAVRWVDGAAESNKLSGAQSL